MLQHLLLTPHHANLACLDPTKLLKVPDCPTVYESTPVKPQHTPTHVKPQPTPPS